MIVSYSSQQKKGVVKRTPLSAFANIRKNGLIALNLRENDELISVKLTDNEKDIIVGTKNGLLIGSRKQTLDRWEEQQPV